ncbi:MAG TPA: FHA domain-containing protein [Thermoanaerobaculia bacterium]
MATSGSIEIPFAAEWAHLRQERSALEQRLVRLEQERGRVSEAVLERVRGDYERRRKDFDARADDLAARARQESGSLRRAVDRQEEAVHRLRFELEEFDLRERVGELLDSSSAGRAAELRREIQSLEADLAALLELQRQVDVIAEGQSAEPAALAGAPLAVETPAAVAAPPAAAAEALPPIPPFTRSYATVPGGEPVIAAARPRLIPLESPDGSGAFFLEGTTIVGRTGDNGLRLLVGTVSRRHAELEPTPDGWVVRDLHSENGTWVNGERIWERLLADGDQVQFGSVALVFRTT